MEQFYTSNVREQSSTAKVGGLTCVETWIDLKTTLKLWALVVGFEKPIIPQYLWHRNENRENP